MATSLAAPFDVAAAIDRVRFAFRADGDGWSGGHDTYAVHAAGGALAVTPLLHEEASAPGRDERIVAGAEATFHAAAIARGSVRLTSGEGAGIVDRDGKLSIDRGAVVESLENRAGGVEQSWSFTRRPAATGDVTVRIAVTGEEFVAGTQSGLHFRDARTGLGVRYGHGSWVDAAGVRTPVPARWDGAAIVLTVPSAVVDGAAYPAALDPAIAPEFGVDRAPPGPADGTSPALASDGHVFLLVWQSGSAIVGAWLGPDGRALDSGSFVVSTNHLRSGSVPYNHAPSIASNGRGFLVAWITSYYTGTVDISEVRAVRVDQEHGVLDPEDLLLGGAPINNASVSSMDVGANGRDYLVAWRYSLSMDHVLGARVSAAGALSGTTTIAVAEGLGAPRVASDGTDYLVAMGRTAMRVGASGALLDPAPLPLPGGDAIVFDGHDYVVAWSESRGVTGSDLFAAHVSTGGAVREPMGIAVSTAPNEQRSPSLTFDGRDVVVAWSDDRDNTCDPCTTDQRATALYAARLARSGVVRDPDGIAVTVPARGARPLVLASNDAGTLLGWAGAPQTSPDGPAAIYGTWLTRAGDLRKLRDPVLARATNDQRAPAVAADGDGGFLVVWQGLRDHAPPGATRAFSWDILGARVGAFGAFGAPVLISDAAGEQYAPAVTFASGRYLVAWQDHRGDTWDIYAARVTRSGVVRDPAGIAIAAAPDTQTAPAVAGGMVVWTNRDEWNALSVRGARVSTTGALRDPMGLALSAAGESAEAPAIAVHGTGYRIAWTRSVAEERRVVTAAIDAAGVVREPTAMPITETALDVSPSVACSSGGCLVVWSRRDPSRGTNHYLGAAEEIYGARVDNAGALSAPAPIALVPPISFNSYGARFTQYRAPRVATEGNGFLVVWESRHGGGFARAPLYDVLATRVSAGASTSAEAFAVASDDVWSRTPVVAANPGGPAIIAYARSELGPSESARFRVVARLLTPDATCAGGACPGASCVPGFGNCDGVATNGCEASLRADPANCGGCGIRCASDHGTAVCAMGQCAVASCAEGFADCDQRADNGCEMDLTAAPILGTLRLPADTVRGTFPASPTGIDFEPIGNSFTYCHRPHGGEHAHLYRLQVTGRIGVELDSDPGSGPGRGTLKTIALRRACNGPASEFACEDWGDSDGDTYGYRPLLARVLDPGEYVVALDGPAGSNYALALRTFTPPLSADCATAPELVPGVFATGDTARGGRPATACYASANRPQHFYAVTIPARHRAILNIGTGEYDTGIVLRAYEACDAPRCLASSSSGDVPLRSPNRYAALGLDNPGDAPRRVIVSVSVTPDAVSEATFSLGVTFAPLPTTEAPNASCDRATSVDDGTHLVGEDSRLATSAATCDAEALQGRVLYYRVTVPAGRVLVVRARSTGSPAITQQVRVLDACGATTCLASLSIGASSVPSVLRHLNASEAPRTWILAVGDAYASAGRLFDLDVSFESLLAAAPRPVAPLSTATVTSRRPWLRWALGAGFDGARVEVCRDRACATVVASFDALGTGGAPAADLPAGVLFWRTRSRVGASTGTALSPTWEFTVGARSAPVNTSWGTTLDVNGDGFADVVVGAADRAYVYLGSTGGLATTPAATLTGPDGPGGGFGVSVASAGDVNGDGYADLVVGAPVVMSRTGRAYVYLGGAGGLAATPATTLTGPDGANGLFGESVASAGDVNGDGYADLVVGARAVANDVGRAYVFLGGMGGLSSTPATTLAGNAQDGLFGHLVASAGDINGDGYADLVVGTQRQRRAYVYLGGAGGLSSTPATTLTETDETVQFGSSVASAGDINGDGYADLVVGALVWPSIMPSPITLATRAYVYLGGGGGLSSTPSATLTGTDRQDGQWRAVSVASAGDVNGDGYADLVVGAQGTDAGGRAYVYFGGASGPSSSPVILERFGENSLFGRSVASAGDTNGDGYADLVVGAPFGTGRAYVFLGLAGGLATTPATTLTDPDGPGGVFGNSVASAAAVPPGRPRAHHPSPTSAPATLIPPPLRASAAVCMVATASPTWS